MPSNKTRVVYLDTNGNYPSQAVITTEFDIYQEALDYCVTVVSLIASQVSPSVANVFIYVFSYDNLSYRYYFDGSVVIRTNISFPVAQP